MDKTPLSASANMARDEYLFNLCHEKKLGFFRLYGWERPSFSFGVSQKISNALNLEFIQKNKDSFSYVRRITGGKAVLHDDEVTYSVVSSEDIFYRDNDLYRSYMLISNALVNAFHAVGLKAYLSQGSPSHLSKTSNPCFSFPTPNELEIDGKKIVGSAQKRDKEALLQHGSIPVSMNYELYAQGANSRPAIIKRSMTTLSEVSNITRQQLMDSLARSFEAFIRCPLEEFQFDEKQEKAIAGIEEKYRSKEWNYRI